MAGEQLMIRALNVAEKPLVAEAVSRILSNGAHRLRSRHANTEIFEFNYTMDDQRFEMVFTSVNGHLMVLDFPEAYSNWYSAHADPIKLYETPVHKKVPKKMESIWKMLQDEARKCQWLILWLDNDREGENIAYEVRQACIEANSELTIRRARFCALTERGINYSMQNLGDLNQHLADAVDVRQEIDLRVGASFTRLQTMLMAKAFNFDFSACSTNEVFSFGSCQFAALGFVVKRHRERESHVMEHFWTINCTHSSEKGSDTFSWMHGKEFDEGLAAMVYEMCLETPTATVKRVDTQIKWEYPPKPLSTIELEKLASRYLNMTSDRTMMVAERLYQAGFISYPRTKADFFPEEEDLHIMVQDQQAHTVWGSYAKRLLNHDEQLWRDPSRRQDYEAHLPIHPTKVLHREDSYDGDYHRLYELVLRHFLACVSQPAVRTETTVEIDIAGVSFSAAGTMITQKGYLEVYGLESWGGSMVHDYVVGQEFTPTFTFSSEVTPPPPLLSEVDLISCMETAGIGTDAIMHEHSKKILDRFYVTKDLNTNCYLPTPLGEALVMGYDNVGEPLWKPELGAGIEYHVNTVSTGINTKTEMLEVCLSDMKKCFLKVESNKEKLIEAMDKFFERSNFVKRCPCGLDMALVEGRKFSVCCPSWPEQCNGYISLCHFVSEAAATCEHCKQCSKAFSPVYKIQLKFREKDHDVDHLGCIICDPLVSKHCKTFGTFPCNIPRVQDDAGEPSHNHLRVAAHAHLSSSAR